VENLDKQAIVRSSNDGHQSQIGWQPWKKLNIKFGHLINNIKFGHQSLPASANFKFP